MKDTIRHLIQQALTRLTAEGVLPEGLTPVHPGGEHQGQEPTVISPATSP